MDNQTTSVKAGQTIFVVMENYRSKMCDEETTLKALCLTKEGAQAIVEQSKKDVIADWADHFDYDPDDEECEINPYVEGYLDDDEDWEVETATPDRYTIARTSDYEYFYDVYIVEKTLEA